MIVYKYVVAERIDVLENGCIRFTQPAALNDPFESFPSFVEYRESLVAALQNDPLYHAMAIKLFADAGFIADYVINLSISEVPAEISKNFALLSLSAVKNHLLMWSHYADSHRGFVIGFDSESSFFRPGDGKGVDGLKAVEYSDERWVIPARGLEGMGRDALMAANTKWFFRKSPVWSYEQEFRILAHPSRADRTIKGLDGHDVHLFKFPADSIKEVIIGYRASEEISGRIMGIVREKYPNASVSQAILDGKHFQLGIHELTGEHWKAYLRFMEYIGKRE
jgi:hypothetical protein